MRIGYVLDKFPKTSETFIYNEVESLSKKNNLTVFSIEDVSGEGSHDLDVKYGNKFYKQGLKGIGSFVKGNLIDRSILETYYRMIAGRFKKHRSDLEVLHRHFPTNSVVYYLAKELEIPYTVTTHARDIFSKERYVNLKNLVEESERVVTISDYNKNYLVNEFNIPSDKITKVHMGIDTEKFSPSPPKQDVTNILTVARLVEKKGIRYGIRAISHLIKKYPELEYNIIGEGPLKKELKNLIENYGMGNKINLLGRVSEEKLLDEYEKADIFLLPCVIAQDGDRDGIPVVLMEAMAMEKLVISTDVSGIPELIEDGRNGIIVEPKRYEEITQNIERILEGEIDIKSMCRNARDKVCRDFHIDDQIEDMEEVFQEVVSRG